MKKSINSIRIGVDNWLNEDRFTQLLDILLKYPCEINQVALITQNFHTPMPIEEVKKYVPVLKKRIKQLKDFGFSAGINILCTIGHHNENLENCYNDNSHRITNIKGEISTGCYCMRDTRYWDNYIKPVYKTFAKIEPEFIWIDDDVRCDHMPIGRGCFCEECINSFNKKYGYNYTREELRENLNRKNIPLRKQWLEHNGSSTSAILECIEKTVHSISKNIVLGFMTCVDRFFENYEFKKTADILSHYGKYPVMWRPGGGVYTDSSMEEFLTKLRYIGMQNAVLPDYVTIIQSEIENFPYQLIKKSPFFTTMEGLLYMTAGSSGASFNILPAETLEPLENCVPYFASINKKSKNFKLLNEKLYGMKISGIFNAWCTDAQAYTNGEWSESYINLCSTELFNFGLPECYSDKYSVCTILNSFTASIFSDDKLLEILSKGVYMDADALEVINNRGFEKYTGFSKGECISTDAIEKYLPTYFNEGISDKIRNCRQAFNFGPSYSLHATDKSSVSLCKLVDYSDKTLAQCSMGLYENKLGGRIIVGGYYPFTWISDYNKAIQLIRLFSHISYETLPSYIDGYTRIKNTSFINKEKICITLFNPTPDNIYETCIVIHTQKESVTLYNNDCVTSLQCIEKNKNYHKFIIPKILPYEIILIEA